MAKVLSSMAGGDIESRQLQDPFAQIEVPSIQDQMVILQSPELMGQYTPEQIQAMQEMTSSAMEGIRVRPETAAAQEAALAGISEVAKGGLTEADKAAAREIERGVSQGAQARQKAILNAMASRGVLGSGMELAARLQGEQQAIDQASQAGENLTQQAQARALQAMGQQGSLAGQMRGQEFGEQADIARARDAINQFNLQNQQRVAEANVGARNQAQLTNLQNRQNLEAQRVANLNQQRLYNKGLYQTRFGNEMAKAGGTSGIGQAQAQMDQSADAARAAQYGAAVGGATSLIGAGIAASDKNLKENIDTFDSKNFLDKLTAHTYDYKNPELSSDRQAGVMAQDLEKTAIGKGLVQESPIGKVVDYNKAGPVMLASLIELHERLKQLEKDKQNG